MGAPLEDARHLAQRYDRMRQEAEAQVYWNIAPLPSFWNILFNEHLVWIVPEIDLLDLIFLPIA